MYMPVMHLFSSMGVYQVNAPSVYHSYTRATLYTLCISQFSTMQSYTHCVHAYLLFHTLGADNALCIQLVMQSWLCPYKHIKQLPRKYSIQRGAKSCTGSKPSDPNPFRHGHQALHRFKDDKIQTRSDKDTKSCTGSKIVRSQTCSDRVLYAAYHHSTMH